MIDSGLHIGGIEANSAPIRSSIATIVILSQPPITDWIEKAGCRLESLNMTPLIPEPSSNLTNRMMSPG